MRKAIVSLGYAFILLIVSGCHNQQYTLTILQSRPDGKTGEEVHSISAASDSLAYARAATLYFLALHARRKMSANAKPYVSKPTGFILVDKTGKKVDSIIGREKADLIRNQIQTLVN
jgi:hypothetical protein